MLNQFLLNNKDPLPDITNIGKVTDWLSYISLGDNLRGSLVYVLSPKLEGSSGTAFGFCLQTLSDINNTEAPVSSSMSTVSLLIRV